MTKLLLPELGENIDAVDVSAVLVAKGDRVSRDQPVIEVETEKASLEVPATADGLVSELLVKEGDTVKVGQLILVIEGGGAEEAPVEIAEVRVETKPPEIPVAPAEVEPEPEPAVTARPTLGDPVPAAPSVRALARELGIDIQQVSGSGPAGRISRDDVKSWAKRALASGGGTGVAQPGASRPLPEFSQWGEVERRPLTGIRKATATNMAHAWNAVPHVTQFDRADVTRLESMRRDFNGRPEAARAKLTMTAIVLKMVAGALKQFPQFNASLDLAAGEIVLKRYLHVGVAVDTERGLVVPVIRDVDRKGLFEVARELGDLAERSRARKVLPDEMAGASFTVSNLGGLGTTYFSPIVNWPEVAILGVGRAEIQAVHQEGQFVPRRILPLSLSYDHRVIDGADAARFLRWVAEALEQPLLLLMDDAER